jgi:SAM-dependent methyltransferase
VEPMIRPLTMHPAARTPDPASQQLTREHLEVLGDLLNERTFRLIEALEITAGWQCWEAGAGGATVPNWLARQVGPTGYVLASDIDTFELAGATDPLVEVRGHDLSVDPPPEGEFDLVHARLVLEHLPDPVVGMTTLVTALRPGGWLLVESADPKLQPLACPDGAGPSQTLANKVRNALWDLLASRTHLGWGRTLPPLLRDAGLTDVAAEVAFSLGGAHARRMQRILVSHGERDLVAAGAITADEIEAHLADLASPDFDVAVFPIVSAWGRKQLPQPNANSATTSRQASAGRAGRP